MKNVTKQLLSLTILFSFLTGCSDTDEPAPEMTSNYFLGIEASTDPSSDVLSLAPSLLSGVVSPINNGYEQPAWMTFFQGPDQIIAGGYTSAPEFTSYELVEGELTKGESFFVDLSIYASDIVDASTMVLMGSARSGLSEKKIYLVNTDLMEIEKTVTVDFGNDANQNLLAFPVDLKVRGSKMFAAYYMINADGSFSTPDANEARIAVFSYPELTFEKIITDDRAPNIGRYYTTNAIEIDENNDIYTFSPSSLACGYSPVPSTNSGILRIKNGETDFDPDYHVDFEALSGGYKINDMIYVANGKAVVRVLKEDENDGSYLWATYAPTSPSPLLSTGVIDLYNQTFTLLDEVPKAGGGWNTAYLVEGTKLYLGISHSSYAGIYIIDTYDNTASAGVEVDGNYAKAILSL